MATVVEKAAKMCRSLGFDFFLLDLQNAVHMRKFKENELVKKKKKEKEKMNERNT